MSRTKHAVVTVAAVAILAAACSNDDPVAEWGGNGEQFFADWSEAWSNADPYDVVRFYDLDVAVGLVQDYRSLRLNAGNAATSLGGEGRAWLAAWIDKQLEPRERNLDAVYFGATMAVAVTTVPEFETAVAAAVEIGTNSIVTSTDMRWRDAHLEGGRPDDRLTWLDTLAAAYLEVWNETGSPNAAYDAGATVQSFPGTTVDLESALAGTDLDYAQAAIATVATGDRSGPGLFVASDSAVLLLETVTDNGCAADVAVYLTLDEQRIAAESRMVTPDTVRRCFGDEAPADGWWNSLPMPPPLTEQITGELIRPNGNSVTVINGTAELERLLEWGLDRLEAAALEAPILASATFAPVPACTTVPGLVTPAEDGGFHLTLCTDAYQACEPDRASCTAFRAADRLGMAHELGHAWLLANLTDATQDQFVASNGLETWLDSDTPWHRRGAEQAAEIIAWGLLEEPLRLVRIGDPPCSQIAAAYELLTGTQSPHACGN